MKRLALLGVVVAALFMSSLASAQGWRSHQRHYRSYSYGRRYHSPSYISFGYSSPSYYYAPSYYVPSYYAPAYCAPTYGYYAPSYYRSPSYLSLGYHHRGSGFNISIGGW